METLQPTPETPPSSTSDAFPPTPEALKVITGIEMEGRMNTEQELVLANIAGAIRRGHPQLPPQAPNGQRVVIVGGGPSLKETEPELVRLVHAGAKLVTLNGAYHWALARNLKPSAQIVLDARDSNARFVEPVVPGCQYLLASQCAPAIYDAVEGRTVWVWHAATKGEADGNLLDAYYMNRWVGVNGGTTVASRAIGLLRLAGHLRFDLFGIDCCWMDGAHHAYAQAENDSDQRLTIKVGPEDDPTQARAFQCAPWHLKQAEDFLQFIRVCGDQFLLTVHGDGLLAYMMATSAGVLSTEG
jgi:hypothetical protein